MPHAPSGCKGRLVAEYRHIFMGLHASSILSRLRANRQPMSPLAPLGGPISSRHNSNGNVCCRVGAALLRPSQCPQSGGTIRSATVTLGRKLALMIDRLDAATLRATLGNVRDAGHQPPALPWISTNASLNALNASSARL